jgi:hypothetical protein
MEYGQIVATRGISEEIERSALFAAEIATAFKRYQQHDWEELCEEDRRQNVEAVQIGERVLAAYPTTTGTIWIITEWDRSATTILFPSEY